MSSYKLTYYNKKGRAEVARMILAKNGIPFKDIRVEIDEWPAFKKTLTNLPFGQIPILEVDGRVLFQSVCICKFLGRKFGMYGKNETEELQIEAIHLTMEDVIRMPVDVGFDVETEGEKEIIRKKFRTKLPEYLGYLENMVGGNGCFVGDSMTVADLAFFHYIDTVNFIDNIFVNWNDYPKLKSVRETVSSDPNIAKWLKTRPDTDA